MFSLSRPNLTDTSSQQIAGVAALFYHSVGGREKLCAANPAAVAHRRIVQSGNVVRHANWTDADGAIGQQGAGLVDALKVVTSRTSVVPAIINLNDTVNFAASHTITIKNSDDVDVSYNLTHANAPTVLTRGQGDAYIDNYPELRTDRGLASVKFSEDAITIPAKSSATVQLTFTEPTDLEEKFLAQYGGYVHVIGDNGETVKITYNGVRGSFKDAQSWETQFGVPAFYDANDQTFRNGTVFPFPTLPKIHFNILWSTREVSFDVSSALIFIVEASLTTSSGRQGRLDPRRLEVPPQKRREQLGRQHQVVQPGHRHGGRIPLAAAAALRRDFPLHPWRYLRDWRARRARCVPHLGSRPSQLRRLQQH
jgi:hypothetical protein